MPRFSLTPGEVFATDYEVVERIGEGGFGSVWRVRQRSTGRVRALKILRAEALVEEDARARFAAEATASARIESEHVVQVLQAGVAPDGTPWLVMELLEGTTLAELVARQGPLDFAGATDLARQVAHALDAAHRVNVVHRDLKPENVFIADSHRADAARTVKLLDFGIAKVLSDARRSTAASAIIGTPLWMAPEQFEQRVSPAVDVWAFGLLVYFALVGRPYWESDAQSLFAVLDEIRQAGRDPCARALRQAGRALPAGFDAWFARCTAPDPRHRFARVGEAQAALASLPRALAPTLVAPTQVAPRPPPPSETPVRFVAQAPTERLRPPRRRWPWAVAAVVVVAAATTAALPRLVEPRTPAVTTPAPLTPRTEAPTAPLAACPTTMAFIAGGTATLATRKAYPVRSFCLDRTEVTVSEYDECVRTRSCPTITVQEMAGDAGNVCNAMRSGFESHPINCVTAAEAEGYCAWRGARLPTSPEWELAAVGPSGTRFFPWGDGEATGARLNTSAADDFPTTAPVGALRDGASPDGVFDLAGNVSEWVAAGEWDPPSRKRTARGGNWIGPPTPSRLSVRFVPLSHRGRSIGFRCAAGLR